MSKSEREFFVEEVISPEKRIKSEEIWEPKPRRMRELMQSCDCPEYIPLRPPNRDVDVRAGLGLGYNEIYFSSFHLYAIHLPLHPLIHYFLYRANRCPMQLHPNVFKILSCALSINVKYNWGICFADIFQCFKLIHCRNGKDLYS